MENSKPEKLMLKIPKWLWQLIPQTSIAFCVTRVRAILTILMWVVAGVFIVIFHYYISVPFLISAVAFVAWIAFFSWSILLALPTIVIRKDCFECQLGFYVIAHERNHLRTRKSEVMVEQETLNQAGDRLIPLLLSNPDMCKDCPFWFRRIYIQAVSNYRDRFP